MKKPSFIFKHVVAFTSGFAATILFHQLGLLGLYYAGAVPAFPWDMTPVPPFGVPKVISLAFFGGLWGVLAFWTFAAGIFPRAPGLNKGAGYWISQSIFGGIFPTLVALFVVMPMKGIEPSMKIAMGGFILNSLWGLGMGIGFKLGKVF